MSTKKLNENEQLAVDNNQEVEQELKKGSKQLKDKAKELMKQLGIEIIYYTTDGYWFTKQELANNHAQANKVDITTFKL